MTAPTMKAQLHDAIASSRANFHRQFGESPVANWIYDDLLDLTWSAAPTTTNATGAEMKPRANYPYDPANDGRVFFINPTDMSDGSGRLYSIDTQEGERVASTTSEAAARELRDALNDALRLWSRKHGPDAVVS